MEQSPGRTSGESRRRFFRSLNLHETLRAAQTQDPDFAGRFRDYAQTYRLPEGE